MSLRRVSASSFCSRRGVSPMMSMSSTTTSSTSRASMSTTTWGIGSATPTLAGPKRAASSFSKMAASTKAKQADVAPTKTSTPATTSGSQAAASTTSSASASTEPETATPTKQQRPSTPAAKAAAATINNARSASSARVEIESKRLATVAAQLANLLGTSSPKGSQMTAAAQAVISAMPQTSKSLNAASKRIANIRDDDSTTTNDGGDSLLSKTDDELLSDIAKMSTAQLAAITAFSTSTMSPAHTTASYAHDRGCQVAAGIVPLSLLGATALSNTSVADKVTCQACLRRRVHNLASEHFSLSTSRRSSRQVPASGESSSSSSSSATSLPISADALKQLSPELKTLLVRSFYNPSAVLGGTPLSAIPKADIPDGIVQGALEEMRRVALRFAASRRDAGYTWVVYNPHYRPTPSIARQSTPTTTTTTDDASTNKDGSTTVKKKSNTVADAHIVGRLEVVNLPNTMVPNALHLWPIAAFNLSTGVIAEGFLEQSEMGAATRAFSTAAAAAPPAWSRAARRAANTTTTDDTVPSSSSVVPPMPATNFISGGHISIDSLSTPTPSTNAPQYLRSALADIRCQKFFEQWARLDWSFVESQAQGAMDTYEGAGRIDFDNRVKARRDAHTLAARVAVMRRYDNVEMDSALNHKKKNDGSTTSSKRKGGKDIDGVLDAGKDYDAKEEVAPPVIVKRRAATATTIPTPPTEDVVKKTATTTPTATPVAAADTTPTSARRKMYDPIETKVDATPTTTPTPTPTAAAMDAEDINDDFVTAQTTTPSTQKVAEQEPTPAAAVEKEIVVEEVVVVAAPAVSATDATAASDDVAESGTCADGTTTFQVLKSGVTAYTFQDGTEVQEFPDGKRVTLDNNTEITTTQFPDGSLHYLYSNGGTVEHKANGEVYVNGELQEA